MTDPSEWFGGARRVMFVHAHPDDETISTGGTLAALAERGLEPLLVTLTRGERGEARHPFDHLVGTDALAAHRQVELAGALAALGVERHVFLGTPPARVDDVAPVVYEDSGMVWGADGRAHADPEASDKALTRVPAAQVLADLLAAANNAGAGALVSYDARGGYGHPDHVFAHRAARAAAIGLEVPFYEILSEHEASSAAPHEGSGAAEQNHEPEWHRIEPWFERKLTALRSHHTQLAVEGEGSSAAIVHVGGQRQTIGLVEGFRRLS